MGMIANDWQPAIQAEFGKPYYKELYRFVKEEYSTHVIYPPSEDIFKRYRLHCRISTGNCQKIWDVIFRIMDFWKNGQDKGCYC